MPETPPPTSSIKLRNGKALKGLLAVVLLGGGANQVRLEHRLTVTEEGLTSCQEGVDGWKSWLSDWTNTLGPEGGGIPKTDLDQTRDIKDLKGAFGGLTERLAGIDTVLAKHEDFHLEGKRFSLDDSEKMEARHREYDGRLAEIMEDALAAGLEPDIKLKLRLFRRSLGDVRALRGSGG